MPGSSNLRSHHWPQEQSIHSNSIVSLKWEFCPAALHCGQSGAPQIEDPFKGTKYLKYEQGDTFSCNLPRPHCKRTPPTCESHHQWTGGLLRVGWPIIGCTVSSSWHDSPAVCCPLFTVHCSLYIGHLTLCAAQINTCCTLHTDQFTAHSSAGAGAT